MRTSTGLRKTVLFWGFAFVAIYTAGAIIDASGISGTCMFILMPAFTAFAVTMPLLTTNRFGTGVAIYVPYAMLGFPPLFFFDWLQSKSIVGLWAVFAIAASGLAIGTGLDLVNRLGARLPRSIRAISLGAVMQLLTFFCMLVVLTRLYNADPSPISHVRFFDRKWMFTLPWMVLNGACGGYAAHAVKGIFPRVSSPAR